MSSRFATPRRTRRRAGSSTSRSARPRFDRIGSLGDEARAGSDPGGSVSVGGTTTVDRPDAVAVAQRFVAQQLPDLPSARSVDCPNDVEAKVGTNFECTATLTNGQKVTLSLRVEQLQGDQVHL